MQIGFSIPMSAVHSAQPPSAKLQKAAGEFESMLLGPLFESLEKSFAEIGEGGALGSGDYSYMGAQALASGMVAGGGIGIAQMILRSLEHESAPAHGTGDSPNGLKFSRTAPI